ncbi:molybdopterin-dependent oxidoreductase [Slackia exigua]|uniref:molybdopterin-dependent oxidoreductase n=1 Tax=Slackia exigua TaxID=84109 RepID=UPI002551BC90|nr:molybdopterin-dependent oxidoreductase [Slackia exigua]MDK7723356.1 molybdopterin-dependent oxidoreductase [Slackia exigua]MDK7724711.1 molybdopterin-dependent oxidoreductase [Slackia exigua]
MSLTRRGFLGTAGAATAIAAGAGGAASYATWLKSTDAAYAGSAQERTAYTFHQWHCGGNCSLKCTVRDGRLVQVEPNDWPSEKRFNTVCLKGISEVQHIYGDTRIQTPLKRIGERGSGEFVSISWDEAFEECATQIKAVQEKYGNQALLFDTCLEPRTGFTFIADFLKGQIQDEDIEGVDVGIGNGFDPALGRYDNQEMLSTNSVGDWDKSKTIIHLGTNIIETNLVYNRWFMDAKEAGAKMWCVDPNHTSTATKCDEWMPIQPGTDSALLLGMITLVLDNKWYNEDYCLKYTSFPFLIDKKTGMLERDRQSKGAPEEGSGLTNKFKVWDGGVKDHDASATPQLEFENEQYITVFSQLKKNARNYPLEWAAEKTHLDADRITQMTDEFANNQPAVLSMGWGGGDKWYNADVLGHCAAVLSALCGIFGTHRGSGAGGFSQWIRTYGCEYGTWETPEDWGISEGVEGNYERRDDEAGVHACVALGDAFLMHYANTKKTEEWLKSLDFVMVVDIYHNMSVDWADIVLPACSKFELNEEIGSVRNARDYVELQQKVIDPLFESKPDYEIELGLAKALGCDQYLPKTRRELVEAMLDSDDEALAGITVDALIANNGLMRLNVPKEFSFDRIEDGLPSQTGRVEVFYDWMVDDGQTLPLYENPNEAYEGNPLMEKYPLQLSQTRSKFFVHEQFVDAEWIQQFYMTTLEMNEEDAKARGLANDDIVRGFNDRGEFKCKVRINNAIRPGTVRTMEGQWPKFMASGSGPVQNVTNDSRNERSIWLNAAPVTPFNDTLIQVEKA